jgi:hypothetical protein
MPGAGSSHSGWLSTCGSEETGGLPVSSQSCATAPIASPMAGATPVGQDIKDG